MKMPRVGGNTWLYRCLRVMLLPEPYRSGWSVLTPRTILMLGAQSIVGAICSSIAESVLRFVAPVAIWVEKLDIV